MTTTPPTGTPRPPRPRRTSHLGNPYSGQALLAQVAAVLDPLASRYRGQSVEVISAVLSRRWLTAFHIKLPAAALTGCARAIAEGTPWVEVVWPDGWYRLPLSASPAILAGSSRPVVPATPRL